MWGGADTESLVAQIKELQRNDAGAKEQWIAYTDTSGGGKRDPSKHDAAFLQTFLMQLNQGASFQPAGGAGNPLSEAIKTMQKRSPAFKGVWASFCAQHGGGRNDPSKHDAGYHAKFLEALAQQASGDMSMGMSPMTGCGENPMKRMRDSSGMGMGTMGGGCSGGGAQDSVVQRVKNFQRMGPEQKELWGAYADMYLQGVRDPSRHDAATLEEFCANHNVPASGAMGGMMGGGGAGGGGAFGTPAPVSNDPEFIGLVDRVKSFQRQTPENKEVWGQFCGATRDPSRHEKAKLQEFCAAMHI